MTTLQDLGTPQDLSEARSIAHAATQLLYRAAVANNASRPGDDHSNLGWNSDNHSFETRPLGETGKVARLRLSPLTLVLEGSAFDLDGASISDALAWLDAELESLGLHPASMITVAYDLPDEVSDLEKYSDPPELEHLAAWFDLAALALSNLAGKLSSIEPGPGDVRCWPHHFDIATYVSLETGDPEEARGIGVGMSPGDSSYDEPYFYVNAWPHLDRDALPDPIKPGHWHMEGFVGSIATGTEVFTQGDPQSTVATFLMNSFKTNRIALGFR